MSGSAGATEGFAAIRDCPAPLLDLTFDQMRTLVAVHQTGSPLAAARLLNREHSSVRKQIATLNRSFALLCGEVLCVKQGRGRDYLFTPTGEAVAARSRGMLVDWQAVITARRRKLGSSITVATTEFTVDFLAKAWPLVAEEFTRREIEVNIVHTRTRAFWERLDGADVDLVCGSVPVSAATDPIFAAYDVIEWHREKLVLITNLGDRELPVGAVSQSRLTEIPILAPTTGTAGLISEFLRRWYGPDFATHLNIVAEVDSVYYGLALLRSGLTRGALLCPHNTAEAALEGRPSGAHPLRLVPLTGDFHPPLHLLAGVFARKLERDLYDDAHPLNLLWDAFAQSSRS
ncbi:LysR family transcriptional regulator [Nocardia puris]|uniref:DNA-binding transcriptional LysR family regulator n=1 Tax=Nocardia puris TaxID=208602 RepID=A0A366DMQ5_9NOCA|nr:LysR family transcriptional regulator [Nocardia puris]RBO91351.1 DNA-binding transcriptional LysR family regulator [Nocardia puris]